MKLVSVTEMQQIEREANAAGLSYARMMENAGLGLAQAIHHEYGSLPKKSLVALVGPGNNGGDALVALARLIGRGWRGCAYLVKSRPEDPLVDRVRLARGLVYELDDDPDFSRLRTLLEENRVLVDGVLGTGTRLPLRGSIAEVLGFVRKARLGLADRLSVVAVDCPSGVDCDSGEAAEQCIPANLTVTMAAIKAGLVRFPASNLVGQLQVASIGPVEDLHSWKESRCEIVTAEWVRHILPDRPQDSHKGTFGTVLIAAGSVNYTGAAFLAGQAAYRSGVGLVTLAVVKPLHRILAGQFPEATWLILPDSEGAIAADGAAVVLRNLERVTGLLMGPGFGLADTTRGFFHRILAGEDAERSLGFLLRNETAANPYKVDLPPIVVDADGLRLLASLADWWKKLPAKSILTPHPGEMAALTGLPTADIQAERLETASKYAQAWGHVVILKGANTVVASPDGELALIPVASPALARAGTGDVLAGLVTGLRAQGVDAYPAALAGAWIHAQAGLKAAADLGTSASVLAGDVLRMLPAVLSELN